MQPSFANTAPAVSYVDERHTEYLGSKMTLFRRALLARDIEVLSPVFKTATTPPTWVAKSESDLKVFRGIMSTEKGVATHKLTRDKESTKDLLSRFGVSVPKGIRVNPSTLDNDFDRLSRENLLPGVVKPNSGSHGSGVSLNIKDKNDLKNALVGLPRNSLFEQQIQGQDYRVVTIGSQPVAATLREPAYVVGDGLSNILQLVEEKNKLRRLNPSSARYPILVDETSTAVLRRQGHDPLTVPAEGQRIKLRDVANLGAGGDSVDVTTSIHPEFRIVCTRVAEALGLPEILGIDIIAEDISHSPQGQQWAVIEVNANPDINLQHWPTKGTARDVAGLLAAHHFPDSTLAPKRHAHIKAHGRVMKRDLTNWLDRCSAELALESHAKKSNAYIEIDTIGTNASIQALLFKLMRTRSVFSMTNASLHYQCD